MVASICISLIISDVEHLFTHLLAICMLSLEKISIHLLCPFYKLGGLFFVVVCILDLFWILAPYWRYHFKYLLPDGRCLVVLSKVSCAV